MLSPIWKQVLERSLYKTRKKPESRYMQIATLGLDGSPKCRTVVFRGYSSSHHLRFITDKRSEKWNELSANPNVSIVWYFAETREQYRFVGEAILLNDKNDTSEQWQKLSHAGKKQFLWGAPKMPRQKDYSLDVDDNAIPQIPPHHFTVVDVEVESVDYLTLRGEPQSRILYEKDTNGLWQQQPVIP